MVSMLDHWLRGQRFRFPAGQKFVSGFLLCLGFADQCSVRWLVLIILNVHNLIITFDSTMFFLDHVLLWPCSNCMQIRYFHFLDICRIKSYMLKTVLVSLTIALVYCLLDYCNSPRVAHWVAQSQCSHTDNDTFQN